MAKVAGAVAVLFAMGAGAMTMLVPVLGGAAEAVALGAVGAGMVGASYAVGRLGTGRQASPTHQGREISETA